VCVLCVHVCLCVYVHLCVCVCVRMCVRACDFLSIKNYSVLPINIHSFESCSVNQCYVLQLAVLILWVPDSS